jgi:hypothetical protein
MITGTKLVIGIVTALLGFAATTSALNAPNGQPASTIPSTVYVPYSIPAPTTTVSPNSCTIVGTLLALEGLPKAEMETALKVAYRESRCTHQAFNATDTNGGSAGYFQVNLLLVQTLKVLAYRLATSPRHFGRLRRAF